MTGQQENQPDFTINTFRGFYCLFSSSPDSSSSKVAQVESCKQQKLIFADKSFPTKHWSGFEDMLGVADRVRRSPR